MNTSDARRSIADLTAEIQREAQPDPDQLVRNIMLTIFGEDALLHSTDEEAESGSVR